MMTGDFWIGVIAGAGCVLLLAGGLAILAVYYIFDGMRGRIW